MAAVLCGGIGDLCKGICNAAGHIICFPCKVCGIATAECCDVLRSPFCLFLSVAFGFNLPPIVFAIQAVTKKGDNGGEDCDKVINWLIINAILCVINIIAAIYIVNKIQADPEVGYRYDEEGLNYYNQGSITNRENSFGRVRDVLCHDPGVAVYIIIGIGYICWASIGISRAFGAGDACGGVILKLISNAVICDYLFIGLGGCAFGLSVCCLR